MLSIWVVSDCDPLDCSPPGSSVLGISQARVREWVAIFSSRGSSRARDWTCVSWISCIGKQILCHWAIWEALFTVQQNESAMHTHLSLPFGHHSGHHSTLSRVAFCTGKGLYFICRINNIYISILFWSYFRRELARGDVKMHSLGT